MGVNNSSDIIHCDEEAGGETMTQRSLPNSPPPVYTIVLEWASASISSKDIMATFAALSTDIDLADLYGVNDAQGKHRLVSMVCCNGQHNCCFTCNEEDHDQWIMYDDEIVKVIGSWNDVIALCGGLCMHPQVLFFEDLNSTECPSGYSSMSRLLMEREKQMKNNLLSREIVESLGTPKRSILSFFSSERSIRYRKLLKREQDLSFAPFDRLESEELVNKAPKFHKIRKVTTFMGMNKLFKTKSR